MAISLTGFGLLTAGARHGGQLVYRLGVGVDVRIAARVLLSQVESPDGLESTAIKGGGNRLVPVQHERERVQPEWRNRLHTCIAPVQRRASVKPAAARKAIDDRDRLLEQDDLIFRSADGQQLRKPRGHDRAASRDLGPDEIAPLRPIVCPRARLCMSVAKATLARCASAGTGKILSAPSAQSSAWIWNSTNSFPQLYPAADAREAGSSATSR